MNIIENFQEISSKLLARIESISQELPAVLMTARQKERVRSRFRQTLNENVALQRELKGLQETNLSGKLWEVHCPMHPAEVAEEFCAVHVTPICRSCHQRSTQCQVKNVQDSARQVTAQVLEAIGALSQRIPQHLLSPEVRQRVQEQCSQFLDANVKLLADLRQIEQSTQGKAFCNRCGQLPVYLDCGQFEVYCESCTTSNGDLAVVEEGQLAGFLLLAMRELFRDTNFCDLSQEAVAALSSRSEQALLQAGKEVAYLASQHRPKTTYESLPDVVYCAGCFTPQMKATCDLRVLPCKSLHALCMPCVSCFATQVECPLDGMVFRVVTGSLKPLRPDSVRAKEDGPGLAGPYKQVPQVPGRPIGIPLTSPVLQTGYHYLDRFLSVLPSSTTPIAAENKGWTVHTGRNQVEVMSFLCVSNVQLCGVSVSNPYSQEYRGYLEYIAIYTGDSATGQPLYFHSQGEELVCGNSLFADIWFQYPFSVRATTKYTVKVKLGSTTTLQVYRGNSFERPEFWVGSDGTLWEFEDAYKVENGEYINGQNNLSGPILRFYYYC